MTKRVMNPKYFRVTLVLCLFVLVTCWLLTAAPLVEKINGEVTDKDFLEWVQAHAVSLDTLDWNLLDLNDLAFLDKALQGKRIVYLGEPDHYIHEKYDFRLILIRFLFARGWRYLGMEMGLADGKRVDRYLETGDTTHLGQVSVYGYKGDVRSDRDDSFKGFAASKNPEFRKHFNHEEYWFLQQLRTLNESLSPGETRLHWFGFDLDGRPGGGYVDAKVLLDKHRSDPIVAEILQSLERVPDESRREEGERLKGVVKELTAKKESMRSLLSEIEFNDLRRTLRCLVDGLVFCEAAQYGPSSPQWISGLQEREKTMFRQMDELLEEFPPQAKIILMAHNFHLSKDYKSARLGPIRMWPSIGSHLVSKLPGQVYSIWMLYDHGRHMNVSLQNVFADVSSHPARIEHLFAKAGPAFLLPLDTGDPRESYLEQERHFVLNGNIGSGVLKRQADAVFFVAKVSEPRMR